LLGAISVGDAKTDFHGVLDPRGIEVAIDSAYLIVPPDSLFYATTDWYEVGFELDTFDFPDSLNAWPRRVWLKTTVSGIPIDFVIYEPVAGRWYEFPLGGRRYPSVMFYGAETGTDEPRLAVEHLPCLVVSPSVVTGQMTVRLQPAGPGRTVVDIYDAVGNITRSLECATGADGVATATWNLEDDHGRLAPEGVYFCRYAAAGVVAVRKVLVAH